MHVDVWFMFLLYHTVCIIMFVFCYFIYFNNIKLFLFIDKISSSQRERGRFYE